MRRPRPFKDLSQRFLVRRYGLSVNWNCTYREIAQVTGISEARVRTICLRHGYKLASDPHKPLGIMPVDSYMALRNPFMRNMY
ncbi:hypothetical protein [Mesorhizobium sp. B2-1-2]|uniref:hypothetical protein n=1 Tax=Mesorhizobium sp. B2-1-2 TaxID=2589973 RepID=UPI001128C6E3|nr:hypothetical protein [Mesorhizobium sp. B2-1-2]TPN04520.1 hypothetical protein FJ971_29695 [Mesorhizobium sp. B2-1-2]